MSVSHRSYDRESIAILTNVEVGQQDIEIVSFHLGERFSNIGSDSYEPSVNAHFLRSSPDTPTGVLSARRLLRRFATQVTITLLPKKEESRLKVCTNNGR
jgi:hypothetical protein